MTRAAAAPELREVAGPGAAERLLEAPPLHAIIRLAAPTTVVMLVATTTNVLQTYFVSWLGEDAIASVSLVFPISMLAVSAMAGGLGAGAVSAVARALGAGRHSEAAVLSGQALLLSVVLGLGFALAILVGAPGLFAAMGGRGPVLEGAVTFARVLFGGAAITFLGAMLDSVLRGEGNVRIPAIWSSMSLTLQMALTPLFMFGAGLGLAGAAVAPLVAQLIALGPRAWFVLAGRGVVTPRFPGVVPSAVGEILRVGIPASLGTVVTNLGIMAVTGIVARLGDAPLAAYGLGVRFDFLLFSFAYGFGAAALTLVGLATGAGRPDRVRAFVLRTAVIAVALLAIPSVILWVWPTAWVHVFSDDPAVLAVGHDYFRMIALTYPCAAVSMVLAFAFQGLGRATVPLVWMVVRVVGVVAVSAVGTRMLGFGARGVFATIAVANVTSTLMMVLLFRATLRAR
jgi:putative MATE family efflux protein